MRSRKNKKDMNGRKELEAPDEEIRKS